MRQLGIFAEAGGEVLFGTDLGYMTDYDPTEEYTRMAEAGLEPSIRSSPRSPPIRRARFDDPAARDGGGGEGGGPGGAGLETRSSESRPSPT